MRPFISFDGVSKRYGPRQALIECSFSIARGEVLCVRGSRGAGHSTLAKLVAGFAAPTAGAIRIDGLEPHVYRQRYGIGYAARGLVLSWNCTVGQLLELRGEVRDSPWTVDRAAECLGMDEILRVELPRLTDIGWRKVLLAYAIVGGSSLIVLDDLQRLSNMRWRSRVDALIGRLASEGAAVVVVGMDSSEELGSVSHSRAMLDDGQLTFLHAYRVRTPWPQPKFRSTTWGVDRAWSLERDQEKPEDYELDGPWSSRDDVDRWDET